MEEITIGKAKARFVGVFDFGDFYRILYDVARSLGYDIEEQKYKQKSKPEGDEVELEWNCYKKVDDYSMFKIFIKTLIVGLKKVSVNVDGVQTSKNEGDCEMALTCSIQTDYENKWETNPMMKFLKGVYDLYIYRSTFTSWKAKVSTEMKTIENEMKAFFQMQRFM